MIALESKKSKDDKGTLCVTKESSTKENMKKIVVFVGNPGIQYKQTRHNTAWLFKDSLNLQDNWQEKFHAQYQTNQEIVYLVPQTFVNESGVAAQACAKFFQVPPECVLIVHDDIELAFGTVKLQQGGGMGGHNALRSVKQHLGTDNFWRLRIGIGRPERGNDIASFVLGRFTELEDKLLEDAFLKARELMNTFIGSN